MKGVFKFLGTAALLALGPVMFIVGIRFDHPRLQPAPGHDAEAATPFDLDAELERCKSIDFAAPEDARCQNVWKANRQHFFAPQDSEGDDDKFEPDADDTQPILGTPVVPDGAGSDLGKPNLTPQSGDVR